MKYVLLYESGEDVRETAPKDFPAHRERWQTFRDAGTLPMIGTFADLNGAVAVFTTREAPRSSPGPTRSSSTASSAAWHVRWTRP
jgi:uncharacterized protein YciI